MPRPGGNPDFGTKFKFDYGNEEKKSEALTIRITPSMLAELKNIGGDEYRDFCRDAINEAIKRHKAAEPTKTVTTELEQAGQQPTHSQTNQEGQPGETDPSQGEQAATPGKRRKAGQTQARKPAKPRNQTRNRRSNATEN